MALVRCRRAQAAIEFLTTYGWAFMIILVMIGAITYFGITNPAVFVPDRCQFSPEIDCLDYQVFEDGIIVMNLKQTTGKTIYLAGLMCEGPLGEVPTDLVFQEGVDYQTTTPVIPGGLSEAQRQWDPRESVTLKCMYDTSPFAGQVGGRVKIPISVMYQKRLDGFTHEVQGEIYATVAEAAS